MHLTLAEVFHAKWTDTIHDEWIESLLVNRPDLKREQLERTRTLMNSHVRDALVKGYEDRIPTLTLPDPNDRHVLAAALHAKVEWILTFNLHDFPDAVLQPLEVRAEHPDRFLKNQLSELPELFVMAVQRHRGQLLNPPKSVEEYLQTLSAQGLVQTVEQLCHFASQL